MCLLLWTSNNYPLSLIITELCLWTEGFLLFLFYFGFLPVHLPSLLVSLYNNPTLSLPYVPNSFSSSADITFFWKCFLLHSFLLLPVLCIQAGLGASSVLPLPFDFPLSQNLPLHIIFEFTWMFSPTKSLVAGNVYDSFCFLSFCPKIWYRTGNVWWMNKLRNYKFVLSSVVLSRREGIQRNVWSRLLIVNGDDPPNLSLPSIHQAHGHQNCCSF